MKRAAAAFVVAASVLSAGAPARADDAADPWLGKDKALHFGVSGGIAIGSYGLARPLLAAGGEPRATALVIAGGMAIGYGVAKETWDAMGHGDPSWKDLTWDVVGSVAGLLVAWGLDVLVAR